MALTRKMLKAMGIEEEKIDQIIEAHTETSDALKAERDKYKGDAEKLSKVQKELNDLKDEIAKNGDEEWKSKYDKVQKEFDDFKKAEAEKAEMAQKTEAYKSLLFELGVTSAKRIGQILKASNDEIKSLELDENGRAKDAESIKESIAKAWDGWIPTESEKGAKVPNPPSNNGGDILSMEEIQKRDDRGRYVMSTSERQAAIAKRLEAEQKGQ